LLYQKADFFIDVIFVVISSRIRLLGNLFLIEPQLGRLCVSPNDECSAVIDTTGAKINAACFILSGAIVLILGIA